MPLEPDANQPHHNVFGSCFHWILMALWRCIIAVLYLVLLIVGYPICILLGMMLLLCLVFILWFVATASSVTFPFLLASWLVLRFSQFVKRGQDYDKVTQVKMFIECFRETYITMGRNHILQDPSLIWGYVMITSIPKKYDHALGLPIFNWFAVPISVVIGWNIITLSTHLIVWSIHQLIIRYLNNVHDNKDRSHRYMLLERLLYVDCLVYYGNGLKRSFNFMLSSLLLLLVWVLYFASHLNKPEGSKTLRDFGTWTCTVLLISSFLWILKDFVLLLWEANSVYSRLHDKIVGARRSLYFLGIIGRHSHDILKLRYSVAKSHLAGVDVYYQDTDDEEDTDEMGHTDGITEENSSQDICKLSKKKRARVKRDLLVPKKKTMTLFSIQQVAHYFLNAADALNEVKTSNIARNLKSLYDNRDILKKLIDGENGEILENQIDERNNANDGTQSSPDSVVQDIKEWSYFERLLKLDSSTCLSPNIVKTWLEKSHNNCLFLANTLHSAKEVVDCLDNIISILLICASIILWLILTGLNTDRLILLASPLIAAVFVFGDTCKTLFQGIIFVYVVHPFDVGDLCVVDGRMMEVKSVGIWKTMFSNIEKIGTREEVIYPNSELAMKTISNHKAEFDWNDSIEFDVEHLDKQLINKLKTQIESLLAARKVESKRGSHKFAVLSSSEDAKIIVRFKHNKCHDSMTNFECFKAKNVQRSKIILDVQELLNKLGD